MNIFYYRCKIINLYYYNNLKKESILPAFIRTFGRDIRIYEGKPLNNRNFILKCTKKNLISGYKMAPKHYVI